MLLIYLILGCILMFQSGTFWCAYKIDKVEGKVNNKMLFWSIGTGLFGLYFLISMVGRAGTI